MQNVLSARRTNVQSRTRGNVFFLHTSCFLFTLRKKIPLPNRILDH